MTIPQDGPRLQLTTKKPQEKILQIMPADGWQIVFKNTGTSEWAEPLVGFALVEYPEGDRLIEPLIAMEGDVCSVYDTCMTWQLLGPGMSLSKPVQP